MWERTAGRPEVRVGRVNQQSDPAAPAPLHHPVPLTAPVRGAAERAALDDLTDLCDRRPVWVPEPETAFLAGTRVRRSAVLVLFGVLDTVAADTDRPVVATDLDLLLTRRSASMSHHPGQVAFPGGGIDPRDDGPVSAALRESQEEAGVDPAGVRVLGTLPDLPVPASGNMVTPVVGWWDRPHQVAATDPAETVEVFRVPVADLVDPEHRATAVGTFAGAAYRGSAFWVGDVLVWGFTAMVLDRLLADAGWAVPWDTGRTVPAPMR